MLDAPNLTRIALTMTPFIMSRGIRVGFKGEDLLDFVQETLLQLWRNAKDWPKNVESELALIRKHADATAIDMLRNYKARKRDAPSLSLTLPDGRELADVKAGAALRVDAQQEDHFIAGLIRHAIRVVAATLSPELERVVISRMLNGNGDGEDYSKNENLRAMRAVRRAIELPPEDPQAAGVTDAFEHLIRTARRIEAAAEAARRTHDLMQETTCANDVMTNTRENESQKSSEHLAMSGFGPSQSRTLWSATAAAIHTNNTCESTPGPRSLLPQSGSAFSRRQASSGSTSTTSPSHRHARRPEATLVTRHQMLEDSSVSGSG